MEHFSLKIINLNTLGDEIKILQVLFRINNVTLSSKYLLAIDLYLQIANQQVLS